MSYKIVIHVYSEDRESSLREMKYSNVIFTPIHPTKIEDYLDVADGYYIQVQAGLTLSFIDFTCLTVSPEIIISKIQRLPTTDEIPNIKLPPKGCHLHISTESNEEPLTHSESELLYTYKRFNCGASGFSELLIEWVATHPIEMIFIGGWIWDRAKDIWDWFRGKQSISSAENEANKTIPFSPKRFHLKVANLINIEVDSFQIINIFPINQGKYKITIRTVNNEYYQIEAKANGKIISIESQY